MKAIWSPVIAATILFTYSVHAEVKTPESREEVLLSFSAVVRESSPAVVNIFAKRVLAQRISPFAGDPFFSQFFGRFERSVPRVQSSLGSGVILDETGLVVSNYHVVGDAADIRVVLSDRREFDGSVVLSDQDADIAVIALKDADNLPSLDFGDSDAVEVGDLVLAIGNPFGVGQTVTSGIISGLARSGGNLGSSAGYYIQTDAPINPGNSGGALVDMRGELIGINTSILTRSGGSNGIGFAIPSNLVRQYVQQTLSGREEFARPWSGVRVQGIDSSLGQALGMDVPTGVLIAEAHPQSPLIAAGLEVGDVLVTIGRLPVDAPAELDFRLATLDIGTEVEIAFLRNGETTTAAVRLLEAPDEPPSTPVQVETNSPLNGLVIANANPRLIDELSLPLNSSGVFVLRVKGYSGRLGLMPGDRLAAINGVAVTDVQSVLDITNQKAREWQIEIVRNGRPVRLQVRL